MVFTNKFCPLALVAPLSLSIFKTAAYTLSPLSITLILVFQQLICRVLIRLTTVPPQQSRFTIERKSRRAPFAPPPPFPGNKHLDECNTYLNTPPLYTIHSNYTYCTLNAKSIAIFPTPFSSSYVARILDLQEISYKYLHSLVSYIGLQYFVPN